MKIRIHKDIFYNLVLFSFIFIFVFAIANVVYWQTGRSEVWRLIWRASQLMLCILSLIYLLIHFLLQKKFESYSLACFIYLFNMIALSCVTQFYGGLTYITEGFTWPLTFIVFYLFVSEKGIKTILSMIRGILLPGTLMCMLLLINNIRIHLSGNGLLGGVIGPLNFCISFLGLLLMVGTKKEKLIYSILTAALIIMSEKRTGTLILLIGLIAYAIVRAKMEYRLTKRIKRYIIIVFGIIIAFFAINWYIQKFDIQIISRIMSSFDDEGSGRLSIWNDIFLEFKNSNIIQKIFGHGYHAVPYQLRPMGRQSHAHNSFLEALYDFGLLGFVSLLGLIVFLCIKTALIVKKKFDFAPAFVYSLVEILAFSILSYFFDESRFIVPVAAMWGIGLGELKYSSLSNSIRHIGKGNPHENKSIRT